MKYSIIDIGSNSMRLTVYALDEASFQILFREKHMAGLAGYIEDGVLSSEGIARACDGLAAFRKTLELLGIQEVSVFATASLRNITNTSQAADALSHAIGHPIEVLSGEDEATFGYLGAMHDLSMDSGLFVDIGGASTEVVRFRKGQLQTVNSYPVGSLKLYRECVKKILPGHGSYRRMEAYLDQILGQLTPNPEASCSQIAAVGGTARAVLKIGRSLFHLPQTCRTISTLQLEGIYDRLRPGDRQASDLILKCAPERIHTLIPGLMILRRITSEFKAQEIIVSSYGVREGYLCQRIQSTL